MFKLSVQQEYLASSQTRHASQSLQQQWLALTTQAVAYGAPLPDSVWQMTRRLADGDEIHPKYDENAAGIATCALDVPQAATYLAMFGIAVDRSTRICRRHFLKGRSEKIYCAASIFEILESISMAGAFISSASSHCAPQTNQQALCASGAVGVVGGITGLTKSGLWVSQGCKKGVLPLIPPIPPMPPIGHKHK